MYNMYMRERERDFIIFRLHTCCLDWKACCHGFQDFCYYYFFIVYDTINWVIAWNCMSGAVCTDKIMKQTHDDIIVVYTLFI
jgi:hypothetical protein